MRMSVRNPNGGDMQFYLNGYTPGDPDIATRLVERRAAALQVGQADGIACRTVEMLEAFGLGQKLTREAYWVNETVFWRPSKRDRTRIERTGRVEDTEAG